MNYMFAIRFLKRHLFGRASESWMCKEIFTPFINEMFHVMAEANSFALLDVRNDPYNYLLWFKEPLEQICRDTRYTSQCESISRFAHPFYDCRLHVTKYITISKLTLVTKIYHLVNLRKLPPYVVLRRRVTLQLTLHTEFTYTTIEIQLTLII